MKIHKSCLVEKVCSTDATRPALSAPFLRGHHVIATDGHMLVALPVEREEHDVDGWVSVDALKAARKLDKQSDVASITANGVCALSNGATFPRPNAAKDGESPLKGKVQRNQRQLRVLQIGSH